MLLLPSPVLLPSSTAVLILLAVLVALSLAVLVSVLLAVLVLVGGLLVVVTEEVEFGVWWLKYCRKALPLGFGSCLFVRVVVFVVV